MNQIELVPCADRCQDRVATEVVVRRFERGTEARDVRLLQVGNHVDVVGEPRLAISDRCKGTGDEVGNLESLELALGGEHRIFAAQSAEAGLTILEDEQIALILTEQLLPSMNGVEFLERSIEIAPAAVRVMCTGRVDPTFIVKAYQMGADGVIISGCHPGDCHYSEGNYKALRRERLLKRLLQGFGISPERLRLVWVSASEGDVWAQVTEDMTETIRKLGPLRLET